MKDTLKFSAVAIAAACFAAAAPQVRADAVTDWNGVAGDMLVQAKMGTPPATRLMAIVQTAVVEAVAAAQLQQPGDATAASAAVAAANRAALAKLLPAQEAAIAAAYKAAIDKLPEGAAKAAGIAAGEQSAARVLAWRADDGASAPDRYRPHAAAGAYVPTTSVATPQWPQRKPWLMADAAQFRPGPPPALGSAQWARDYNEVKTLGGRTGSQRTPEQTEIARFWEYSLPPIYHAVVRSVASAPGRNVAQNARLFAAASQAMDDALIAVMDAKYHYGFWRPVTAIRNGDRDGNAATDVDAGWVPLIDTPLHPEYPSAHSILAGALGELLKAEAGAGRMPELSTSSPTANGATRRWTSVEAFMQEVGNARIWDGIHYRTSTDVGLAMGRQIGALATTRVAQSPVAVPQALAPAGAAKLVERIAARGVQIYECKADAAAPGGAAWSFVAPKAELFDASGSATGSHYGGPHWEAADGSKVVGAVQARADAPQPDAIPWLLLSARSVGKQEGRFAKVTSIQRVNTSGGLTPARACRAGETETVPYTADYVLYGT